MKIYTRTGDLGTTSLADGSTIYKYDDLLQAYGSIDELNAFIGLLIAEKGEFFLTKVQNELFTIGGLMATPTEKWEINNAIRLDAFTCEIETEIDRLQESTPPFRGFILPQGSEAIARAHVCRTICRRTERQVALLASQKPAYNPVLKLLNRLSDYFFILARYFHKKDNIDETIYKSIQ